VQTGYKCCFTGHRDIPDKHMLLIPSLLDKVLEEKIRSLPRQKKELVLIFIRALEKNGVEARR
jgi:hypothetical protein